MISKIDASIECPVSSRQSGHSLLAMLEFVAAAFLCGPRPRNMGAVTAPGLGSLLVRSLSIRNVSLLARIPFANRSRVS